MNFLFLPDRGISGVDWGGSKSNMSKMVSFGSSSVSVTSLESFKRCFCKCFWCLLCVYLSPSAMYTISPILFFNYFKFPNGRVILKFFKVFFSPGLNLFLGANVVFCSLSFLKMGHVFSFSSNFALILVPNFALILVLPRTIFSQDQLKILRGNYLLFPS